MPTLIAAWSAALIGMAALSAHAEERLRTDSFDIRIDVRCEEGVVGCDKVRFTGVERRTGKVTQLTGKEVHTRCADGVTPCRFLGYVFRRGDRTYHVWENGTFVIRRNGKVVLQEQGTPQ